MPSTKSLTRACALTLVTGAVGLSAGPAAAHVTISPEEGAAGSYTVLTVGVPHGCDGSPTTKVAIQMPDQIMTVTPTRNPLWDVRKVMQQLEEPVADAHGNEITERVEQVVYTAKQPLPEGYRDAFELSLQLPDAEGETLAFPAVQTCEQGETAWVETSEDGDTEELEAPAPAVAVLAAEEGGHGSDVATEETSAEATTSGTEDSGTALTALSIAALVAGLLALVIGTLALLTARRRT